ncbi:hypothetical protein ACIGEP_10270 [Microbacterium sp. NPDC077663]|uniref:hypothetical protein n=1 Tax=Microbacterium sp. NPDC077663 TaxID=3364189 RepID=UPI0037CAF87A
MPLIKPPHADPSLDRFDDGAGVLALEGRDVGFVFTAKQWFWSLSWPLRRQWWIWYIVVWNDGERERSTEDYPPFIAVEEMKGGHLTVDSEDDSRSGRYDLRWLHPRGADEARTRWSITPASF